MNAALLIDNALSGKRFGYKNDKLAYDSCKMVSGYVMIRTDVKTLQVAASATNEFLDEIEYLGAVSSVPSITQPKRGLTLYESPESFKKLSQGFDKLLDELDSATENDLDVLKKRADMLTSIGASAVAMETTKINAAKILNGL